ncbi:MAG: BREX-1 system adenine-specific DNA-methyltransferase PglX [Bacteroidetes bacterium]|nr:BREX-1 system adenine-specific DNA-methyltransferase PglX [Bacteroidota bacterium]
MNMTTVKAYAQQARREFIAAITERAAEYGLRESGTAPLEKRGDVVFIGGRAFPGEIEEPRRRLEQRIRAEGFGQVIEGMAYTWFNRLVALRYMELYGFLKHGLRVLSHPDNGREPEILQRAHEVDFPDLNRDQLIALKLDGLHDEELYRLLLLAQCRALHRAMPLLFDPIGYESELLLPRNLLRRDSVIHKLVRDVEEDAWDAIEIVGWLYQFYISERKDKVIGSAVAAEDLPAATQLFTPNWIVKYMVQNSLGAMYLATYPESKLAGQMEYYIVPSAQTAGALASITPSALDPEEIRLMDPAVGSGHILVEAYDLFRAIYLERGYTRREIPRLILTKNLFGLDIDPRAAQLASFAVLMKGLADDPRLLEADIVLNVVAIRSSTGLDVELLVQQGTAYGLAADDLRALKTLYRHGSTFGSLIRVPEPLYSRLPALAQLSRPRSLNMFIEDALRRLRPLVDQTRLLGMRYDVVVANPPYMASSAMTAVLKKYVKKQFPQAAGDLFACFIERNLEFSKPYGRLGFMSPFVWMFLSAYESLRKRIIGYETITSLVQLEYSGFAGATVPICTFTLQKERIRGYHGGYIRLSSFRGSKNQAPKTLEAINNHDCGWFFLAAQNAFLEIPGSPIVYWVSNKFRDLFVRGTPLGELVDARVGLQTSDNARFLRRWWEVDLTRCGFGMKSRDEARRSGKKWFPHNKGGPFRKWYGNHEYVVNWEDDGREIRAFGTEHGGRPKSVVRNPENYFREAVTWSDISSGPRAFRLVDTGTIHGARGPSVFEFRSVSRNLLSAFCNTPIMRAFVRAMNPTLSFNVGNFINIPFSQDIPSTSKATVSRNVDDLLQISRMDWDAYERSWAFERPPWLFGTTIESSYGSWRAENNQTIATARHLEEENNHLFIEAYELADEFSPALPKKEVTLTVNPTYRYEDNLSEAQLKARFLRDTMAELVSYAIGCMMGRYSLDVPGLVYAKSRGHGFESDWYTRYPADDDGIVPITDDQWFEDDAAKRFERFVATVWDAARLEDNLAFIAAGLQGQRNKSRRDTIRRYVATGFYKDHLKTYQKRPIYWLFTSGRRKAFQCLVYLHRYHEGTLARIRTEYAIPLQGMIGARILRLTKDIEAVTGAQRRRLDKERGKLRKDLEELRSFDEKLRYFADQRIQLDLDDGVKVNYGRFGDLLAEVPAITGKKPAPWT